jgi:hypothetical protein
MKNHTNLSIITLALALTLIIQSCGSKEENPKGESKVKAAVKETVTQDFKLYEGAKDALKQTEEKSKTQQQAIDKELNDESK